MKTNKASGFSTVTAVVAVIAVVVIAGLVIWRVLEANKAPTPQNTNTPSNQQQEPQTDPNEGYVVIKEWGVRFKPAEGLTGVEYFHPKTAPGDAISVVTAELASKEPLCGKDTDMLPLGLLQRTTSTPDPANGGVISEINGYTYQYRVSGAACSEDDANISLESRTGTLIVESVKTLEAAK